MQRLIIFCVLIFSTQSFGQEAKIVAPEKADIGDLIILDGTTSAGTGHVWKLTNSTKTFMAVEGGTKCVFASGTAGDYTFVLAVAKEGKASLCQHTVTIGKPKPPTPPDIPPDDDDPIDESLIDKPLSTAALDLFKSDVQSSNRKAMAKKLATNYRKIAAKAKESLQMQDVVAYAISINDKTLGNSKAEWETWRVNIGRVLDSKASNGEMDTPAAWEKAFLSIADALKKGAKG